jgi:hypothetical protein
MTEKNVKIVDKDGQIGWCLPSAFDAVWKSRGWKIVNLKAEKAAATKLAAEASDAGKPANAESGKPAGDWTAGENGSEGSTPETETKEGSK